jgi:uncharacterized protein (TIGR01777 family)
MVIESIDPEASEPAPIGLNSTLGQIQPNRVLLSGASGLLGSALARALLRERLTPTRLVRHSPQSPNELQWNPQAKDGALNLAQLEGLHSAIHLSGANVAAQRWTKAYKEEIRTSRLQTTTVLAEALARLAQPPPTLITASAIGYYGDRGNEPLDESSPPGSGFFPELCAQWEHAAAPAAAAGIRVLHPRFGVVLGRDGGALARLKTLFRLGLGGPLGNGRQWISWISQTDAIGSILFALNHPEMSGAYNAVSPEPVTNFEFTQALAKAVHRPAFLAAPAFALRLAFGQMADEALLASTRAIPLRLLEAGFAFRQPTLESTLQAALNR